MKLLKISLVSCLFLLCCAAMALAQESKVGFVNPQRIINESKIGRIAQEDLSRLGKEKDRRVREALAQVEEVKKQLEASTLSVSQEQVKEKALRLKAREYESLVQRSNLDIQGEERRLIQFVMRRADFILKRIAEEQGFTMILTDPEIIGYVAHTMDITDRVILELNSLL